MTDENGLLSREEVVRNFGFIPEEYLDGITSCSYASGQDPEDIEVGASLGDLIITVEAGKPKKDLGRLANYLGASPDIIDEDITYYYFKNLK